MADDNQGWGGRTPSPRRDDGPRDNYGGDRDRDQRRNDGPPSRRDDGPGENPGNNLHVSGLAIKTTDQDLEEIFGKFGKIDKCQIMKDPHTRDSRGFGFVTFIQVEDAEAATAALNATTLDGKTIGVEKARRGRARTPTPGQYHGPAKARSAAYRPYEPRRDDRRDDRYGAPRREEYGSMRAQPMRDDRRGDDRRDDRRYDDRRIDSRYDDRRGDDNRRGEYRRERDYDDRPRRDERRY